MLLRVLRRSRSWSIRWYGRTRGKDLILVLRLRRGWLRWWRVPREMSDTQGREFFLPTLSK